MCFAPQRRALFRHLNLQKWSDAEVFCTFWLGNVLRATTACNFSSLIWPAGSAPAALASLLFDPPEPQIIGKTQCFATFLPFRASASSFFWSFLFWLFSPLLFNCPYCRKLSLLNFLRILTTNHFPVLLRTTKLARTASQYYFVLQSLHEPLPSTTSCCKACANRFPVLLRATKLARTASQYYFVLQSLHEPLPSTTPCYKACTNRFPVRLHSTSLLKLPPPAFHHTMVSILLLYFNFPPLRSTIQWSPFSFFIYTFPPWFPPYHGLHSTSLFKLPPLAFHQTMVSILLLY